VIFCAITFSIIFLSAARREFLAFSDRASGIIASESEVKRAIDFGQGKKANSNQTTESKNERILILPVKVN
jgi:hypothetical protein